MRMYERTDILSHVCVWLWVGWWWVSMWVWVWVGMGMYAGAICQESLRRGGPRAWYFHPPLVTHLGDAVLGTTKPQNGETHVIIHRPAAGEVLKCKGPGEAFSFEFEAKGLVYDAEYSWQFFLGGQQRGELQKGLKIDSPQFEEECSDSPAVRLGIQFFDLSPGPHEIAFELLEEESETSQVISRSSVNFSVADDCPVVEKGSA